MSYWEIELDSSSNSMSTQNEQWVIDETSKEIRYIYDSVEKYGGYYISRNEIGLDDIHAQNAEIITNVSKIYSRMGKMPYTCIGWGSSNDMTNEKGGVVEIARSLYKRDNMNYGIASTLIYNVQWDTALQWLLDSGETDNADSRYADVELKNIYNIEYDNSTLKSIITKDSSTCWILSTGALERNNKNNIYDMAGNVSEWVMEGTSTTNRAVRGGMANQRAWYGASRRDGTVPGAKVWHIGFRTALYIK